MKPNKSFQASANSYTSYTSHIAYDNAHKDKECEEHPGD